MIRPLSFLALLPVISPIPLHGWTASTPVPHWVALIVAVLGLWLVIGGGVLVVDRLLSRLLGTK